MNINKNHREKCKSFQNFDGTKIEVVEDTKDRFCMKTTINCTAEELIEANKIFSEKINRADILTIMSLKNKVYIRVKFHNNESTILLISIIFNDFSIIQFELNSSYCYIYAEFGRLIVKETPVSSPRFFLLDTILQVGITNK